LDALSGPDVTVTVIPGSTTPDTEPTPLRDDIIAAYRAALATTFKDAPIVPLMSAGATDGSFLRSAGIPVYGIGGVWGIIGEPSGAHGLDERVLVDGFHGQVPILTELLKRLAG
jgi:acetylornithine deacetylase/succinyl-diaminopimelate desuccinylase-like protein